MTSRLGLTSNCHFHYTTQQSWGRIRDMGTSGKTNDIYHDLYLRVLEF